jgi:hypothetical protein
MSRGEKTWRRESCVWNRKWITSVAAMLHLIRAALVRDALVLVALARPALSLCSSYFLAPSTLTLAKMLFLVFIDLGDVPRCPTPMLTPIHPDVA